MGYNKFRPPVEPGVNRSIIKDALTSWEMEKVDTKDPVAVRDRVKEYLIYCQEADIPPSVAGCASWLGLTPASLTNWYTGKTGSPQHQEVMIRFYNVMQSIWARDMHDGNVNPVAGIFMGKVFYGYKDTQEIVIKQNDGERFTSPEDLIAESKLLPGGSDVKATPRKPPVDFIEAAFTEPIDFEKEKQSAIELINNMKEQERIEAGKKKREKKPNQHSMTKGMTPIERQRLYKKRYKRKANAEREEALQRLDSLYAYEDEKRRRKAAERPQKGEN